VVVTAGVADFAGGEVAGGDGDLAGARNRHQSINQSVNSIESKGMT
jgi:hypothetical protein